MCVWERELKNVKNRCRWIKEEKMVPWFFFWQNAKHVEYSVLRRHDILVAKSSLHARPNSLQIHWIILSSSPLQINLRCGSTNELFQVSEPSRCEYLMEFKTPAACRNVGDSTLPHEHGGELWFNIGTLKSVQNFYWKQNQIVIVINFSDALMMMMMTMISVWVL